MHKKNLLLLMPLCLLAACSSQESPNKLAGHADRVSAEQVLASADSTSFSSDIADINSASRKVIRTADFRCRVNDVFTATTSLENIVKKAGGIVQESRMVNDNNTTESVYYKADSVKQVQSYTTTAYLTLRVPAASLDSVLNAIPALSVFVEQRSLAQQDVTLQYLSNALKNKTTSISSKPMALAKKSNEAIQADSYDNSRKEAGIDRGIENLAFLDKANYATITVAFSQPQRINTVVVVDPQYFSKPPYGLQFMQAMSRGWELLRSLLLVCMAIWPLWLVAIIALAMYRKFRKPAMPRP